MDDQFGFLSIPTFKQSDNSLCGPACLKIVLGYFGKEISEAELAKLCNHSYELGTDDHSMKKAVESLDFSVIIKNEATYDDIEFWLSLKTPVIVDWFSGGKDEMANGHSSVVVGLSKDKIYIFDPEDDRVKGIDREEFMRVWFDFRTKYITTFENMIIRQIFIILPK